MHTQLLLQSHMLSLGTCTVHTHIAGADDLLLPSVWHHHLHLSTNHVPEVGLGTELNALGHGPSDRGGHALTPVEAFESLVVVEWREPDRSSEKERSISYLANKKINTVRTVHKP